MSLDYVPEGQQAVAPYLIVPDAEAEASFLARVFEAERITKVGGGEGGVHMELRIGDTVVMMGQPPVEGAPQPANLHVYVPDVDEAYRRALDAGASPDDPPQAQSYGDRRGRFTDPAGHRWWIATRGVQK